MLAVFLGMAGIEPQRTNEKGLPLALSCAVKLLIGQPEYGIATTVRDVFHFAMRP
jgi:hypothetical protein